MMTLFTVRLLVMAAAVLLVGAAALPAGADDKDKKDDPFKLPPLDAKEWKKLDNGMRTWDVKEGKGDAVKAGATVTIHYTGWTLDGKVFDSSKKGGDGQPITFPLRDLIQGWQEGVPGMKPGGVRRLEIPYQLAYGERGSPPDIPAKATLVFEIELMEDPFKLPDLTAKEWKKLDNGMRTWDVKVGDGEEVKAGATVNIHYTGWLTDGTVFDSSKKRGKTIEFPLANLIKGWQEGVPGMKVGGVRRLEIPYQLAYGEAGRPPTIPAKATLIFEIEVKGTK